MEARRGVVPAVERLGTLLIDDVGVPVPELPRLVSGIDEIAMQTGVTIALIAHAGDGNTHPLVVYDPSDPAGVARARDAFGRIMDLAIELGGTITGEHGVGRLKTPWLSRQIGEVAWQLNAAIKRALHPQGILNPGVMLVAHSDD